MALNDITQAILDSRTAAQKILSRAGGFVQQKKKQLEPQIRNFSTNLINDATGKLSGFVPIAQKVQTLPQQFQALGQLAIENRPRSFSEIPQRIRETRPFVEQQVTQPLTQKFTSFVDQAPLSPIGKTATKFIGSSLIDTLAGASALRGAEYLTSPQRREEVGREGVLSNLGAFGDVLGLIPIGFGGMTSKAAKIRTIYNLPSNLLPAKGKPTLDTGKTLYYTLKGQNIAGKDFTKLKAVMSWVIDRLSGGSPNFDELIKRFGDAPATTKQWRALYAISKKRNYDIDAYKEIMAKLKGIKPTTIQEAVEEVKPQIVAQQVTPPAGIEGGVKPQVLKELRFDPARLEKRVQPPNTVGNPSNQYEAQIRYKGLAADKKAFDTEQEAQKFLDSYEFKGMNKSVAEDYLGASFDPFPRQATGGVTVWYKRLDPRGNVLEKKGTFNSTEEAQNYIQDIKNKGGSWKLYQVRDVEGKPLTQVTGGVKSSVPPTPKQEKFVFNINLNRLKLTPQEKQTLKTNIEAVKPTLEEAKGKPLTTQEVINAAKTSEVLQKVTTREQTLAANAAMLKARQNMVALDKDLDQLIKAGKTKEAEATLKELVDSLRVVSSEAADRGRKLQSLSIEAGDESLRATLLKEISKVEGDTMKIVAEATKVDWNNANSITDFYRKFIKPTTLEILDEFRYQNLLSNPLTHLRNIYSNFIQTAITRPLTLAASGKPIEAVKLYAGELKAIPKAFKAFSDSFTGKTAIEKPDLARISTNKLPRLMTVPSRAMEAADQFFQTLLKEGEIARGASPKEAGNLAKYTVFRSALDPKNVSGQGKLLSAIDNATSGFYEFGRKFPPLRWFVPFVQTPMSIAKQWLEYSPAGFATIPGADIKRAQLAKAVIGSVVTAMGAKLALDDRTTWLAPTDPKEKELFYASGKKPFSIEINDKWFPMPFLGIFALPVALASAAKYYQDDSRTALTDDQLTKLGKSITSMFDYFSGQTFMEGLGNFTSLARGDKDYSLSKNLAFTGSQIIPMSGLVGYVSRLVDPVYRKASGFGESVMSGIPFASKSLPAYENPLGEESKRNLSNYIAPYSIGIEDPRFTGQLEGRGKLLQSNAVLNVIDSAIENGLTPKGDPNLIRLRKAEYAISRIKTAAKEDKDKIISDLESSGIIDQEIYQIILLLKEYDKQGITKQDRDIMLFEDPTIKAQRIINRLESFTNRENKLKHLDRLIEIGIIDDETNQEIIRLKKSPTPPK